MRRKEAYRNILPPALQSTAKPYRGAACADQSGGTALTVYVDLLFLNNFCADGALLYCAVKTVKGEAKLWRIALTALLGAVLGTGYSIFGLYYTLPAALDIFIKYGVAALLPLLAAKFKKKRTYALCSLAFVGYMFAFAGMLTALFARGEAGGEGDLTYTYQTLPSGLLVLGAVAFSFGAVKLVRALSKRRSVVALVYPCKLFFRGKEISAKGFADTGNRLATLSGKPVAVADRALVCRLLEDSLFTGNTPFEKIGVRTVNGNSEMKVFFIEKIEIYCAGRVNIIENAAVGVSAERLGEYDLILPHSFTEEGEEGKEGEKGI